MARRGGRSKLASFRKAFLNIRFASSAKKVDELFRQLGVSRVTSADWRLARVALL
jgi:hypothetical protein